MAAGIGLELYKVMENNFVVMVLDRKSIMLLLYTHMILNTL